MHGLVRSLSSGCAKSGGIRGSILLILDLPGRPGSDCQVGAVNFKEGRRGGKSTEIETGAATKCGASLWRVFMLGAVKINL